MKQTKPFRLWSCKPGAFDKTTAYLLGGYDTLEDAKAAAEHVAKMEQELNPDKGESYYIFKGKSCLWYYPTKGGHHAT